MIRKGYTLFEMVLVLALLVVITTIIYPSLDAMYGDYRLTSAADMVRAAWATARAHAMDEGVPYRFAVVPGRGNYRIAPDTADYWAESSENSAPNESATAAVVYEDIVPSGVRFASVADLQSGSLEQSGDTMLPIGSVDLSQWSTTAVFLPDGTARDDVEITFYSRGCRPLVLRLRALTGVVTVRALLPEDYQ